MTKLVHSTVSDVIDHHWNWFPFLSLTDFVNYLIPKCGLSLQIILYNAREFSIVNKLHFLGYS